MHTHYCKYKNTYLSRCDLMLKLIYCNEKSRGKSQVDLSLWGLTIVAGKVCEDRGLL